MTKWQLFKCFFGWHDAKDKPNKLYRDMGFLDARDYTCKLCGREWFDDGEPMM